ncbi:porin [Coralliovum pocilloporae]|uniref:porin n=1 Tax=Coralliovum pocilloporae TaxID=3066369 RepID=UPI003306D58B
MNFKTLVLGSAAALMTVAGAQAADLPAEPVDYVRVCDAYGSGFYYLPGTDTCLRVGGRVRADYRYIDADTEGGDENDLDFRARSYFRLDARTQTDFGLLRAYSSVYFTVTDNGSVSTTLEAGFVQWGGFTFGRVAGGFFYPTWGGHYSFASEFGVPDNYEDTNVLAYTFDVGNGVSATVALEDANGIPADTLPILVGKVVVNQSWGTFDLSGAVGEGATTGSDDTGFAIGAGLEVNVPVAGANDRVGVYVLYADDLAEYSAFEDYQIASAASISNSDLNDADAEIFHVSAGFLHFFSSDVSLAISGSYSDVDVNVVGSDIEAYSAAATLSWTPVSGLVVGLEAYWQHAEIDAPVTINGITDDEFDVYGGVFRVQRTF